MAYKLFEEVVLLKDIPEKRLKKGDVATIVEHHPVSKGEDGYSLSGCFSMIRIDTTCRIFMPGSREKLLCTLFMMVQCLPTGNWRLMVKNLFLFEGWINENSGDRSERRLHTLH